MFCNPTYGFIAAVHCLCNPCISVYGFIMKNNLRYDDTDSSTDHCTRMHITVQENFRSCARVYRPLIVITVLENKIIVGKIA